VKSYARKLLVFGNDLNELGESLMPEVVMGQLVKIVLLLILLGGLIFLLIAFINPKVFDIGGAINLAISNLVASILG